MSESLSVNQHRSHRACIALSTALITLCTSVVGAFFGFWAVFLYSLYAVRHVHESLVSTGIGWGLISGVLAGMAWSRIVYARGVARGPARLNRFAAWMGLAAGLAATLLLHARLMIALGSFEPLVLLRGLAFGAAVGLGLGKVLGILCERQTREWTKTSDSCTLLSETSHEQARPGERLDV